MKFGSANSVRGTESDEPPALLENHGVEAVLKIQQFNLLITSWKLETSLSTLAQPDFCSCLRRFCGSSLPLSHQLVKSRLAVMAKPRKSGPKVLSTFGFGAILAILGPRIDQIHSSAEPHDTLAVVTLLGRITYRS
jgi:hypothetical protein